MDVYPATIAASRSAMQREDARYTDARVRCVVLAASVADSTQLAVKLFQALGLGVDYLSAA